MTPIISAYYNRHAAIVATYVDRRDPAFARLDSGELRLGKRKARGECLHVSRCNRGLRRYDEGTKPRKHESPKEKAQKPKHKSKRTAIRHGAARRRHRHRKPADVQTIWDGEFARPPVCDA